MPVISVRDMKIIDKSEMQKKATPSQSMLLWSVDA